jgi:hypothetical protein
MSRILGIPEMIQITCWTVISGYFIELKLTPWVFLVHLGVFMGEF